MFIDIKDIGRINVVRAGPEGRPPLLFLHPVGLDLTWWGAQFDAFGRERDVVAYDLPGHGLSDNLSQAPSFDIMALVLERVIESIGGHPAHLVGLSVGGMIAQTLALRRPDLVRSLCLVATLCTFAEEVRGALRERARIARSEGMPHIAELSNQRWFTSDFRERRPDILARATRSLLQQSSIFHAGIWDMISGLELEMQLGAISCPTLVLTGAADVNAPPSAAAKIKNAIPGSSLKVFPDLGHFPPFEAAAEFNQVLGDFIEAVEASTG